MASVWWVEGAWLGHSHPWPLGMCQLVSSPVAWVLITWLHHSFHKWELWLCMVYTVLITCNKITIYTGTYAYTCICSMTKPRPIHKYWSIWMVYIPVNSHTYILCVYNNKHSMFETCDTCQDLHAYTLEVQFAMFHSCYSAFSILQCLKMVFSGCAKQWILFFTTSLRRVAC